jgi:hypothetical protein
MNPLTVAIVYLPCIASVIGGAYCAVNHVDGWGWFLFVAVLLGGVSWKSERKESE